MIRVLLLVLVSISWAAPPALKAPACKKCNEIRTVNSFDNKCKECLYKIYDELADKFDDAGKDLYCNCKFSYAPNGKCYIRFSNNGCFKLSETDDCVDLEHVVPKSLFENNPKLSNDFHNLFPAIGIINSDRGTKYFAESFFPGDKTYGNCKTSIDTKTKRIFPQKEAKGKIARAYLYMMDKLPSLKNADLNQGANLEQTMKDWNYEYPPTPFECKREKLIYEIQGEHNPHISRHPNCKEF